MNYAAGAESIYCPSGRDFTDDEIKRLYEAADLYSAIEVSKRYENVKKPEEGAI